MVSDWRPETRALLPKRALLLLTTRTYRAPAFVAAAERVGIEIVNAIDMDQQLADYWHYPLGINFSDPESASQTIVKFALEHPLGAILAVDDSGGMVASLASDALNLPHNKPQAALAARNKYLMRDTLASASVPQPNYQLFNFSHPFDHDQLTMLAGKQHYPCIIKPLELNGSRGVIRANNEQEFTSAAFRLYRMLLDVYGSDEPIPFLVEEYIDGIEVALEGLIDDETLFVLAIFDKPDPLVGPYFEETIYITPSQLPRALQDKIRDVVLMAAEAIKLSQGPVHAELRIDADGPKIIEIAGRSIGGLCSQTLRFGIEVSLEEMILRQAFGLPFKQLDLSTGASGVMMVPIPEAGILKSISGCDAAQAVPLVEEIEITAKVNYPLVPLPEGDHYLGFIFAHGETPEVVEQALRSAHSKLEFEIAPQLPMVFP